MVSKSLKVSIVAMLFCLVGLIVWIFLTFPKSPVALIRVVDAANQPIAGAIIKPEGLRAKPGPYVGGWYSWQSGKSSVPNPPVSTDAAGYAQVPYPKYVFERIETGTLCLRAEHPEFVPARPEVRVAFSPPAGAPWRERFDFIWGGIRHGVLLIRADPIVLQRGAALRLSVKADPAVPQDLALFAQVSGLDTTDTNFWGGAGPGVLLTRRLPSGAQTLQMIGFDAEGSPWFSPIAHITTAAGQTNELELVLRRGVIVTGRLDDSVPRPVRNGRVVAHVWPQNETSQSYPPQWHTWSRIREDGSFDLGRLPDGQLEVVAMCDGFVSTNGPGQFPNMHYPQKALLESSDLTMIIGMEPTACLAVTVKDEKGEPLKDAQVQTSPNVRYGEWSATIICEDLYRTADLLRGAKMGNWWAKSFTAFQGKSDASGVAIIPNLPREVGSFSVHHPRFTLPARDTGFGQKRREASISLTPGATNQITVQLEPLGQSAIAHY